MRAISESADPGTRPAGAAAYDAVTPGALTADQIAFVEAIQRKFLQALARRLSNDLETPIGADLTAIEQMPFQDFFGSRDENACLISLHAGASGGDAILELTAGFLHRVLAQLIGAPENAARPERGLTGIERHIVRECMDNLILDLRETWASYSIRFEAAAFPTEEQAPAEGAPGGSAVVVAALLGFGDAQESIRLAVPALLVRLASTGQNATPAAAPTQRPVLLEALRHAEVQVEAVMGGPSLRMRDLLALAPGQVVMFGPPANCSIECLVNGVSKFRGELVSSGRHQAFQIEAPVAPPSSRTD